VNRRSLTPPIRIPNPGLPPARRAGARRNVSYRVQFFRGPTEITGWALNMSRGGLRAIVEEHVELGEVLEINIADEGLRRRGRIVWTQEEPDGMIMGISFEEPLGAAPPGVDLDASVDIAPGELARTLDMAEEELSKLEELRQVMAGMGLKPRGGGSGGGPQR